MRKEVKQVYASYGIDLNKVLKDLAKTRISLHCWQLDFTWTPTGPAAGWSFALYVRDLPDIKLNAGSTETK